MTTGKPGKRKQRSALKDLFLLIILSLQGRTGRYSLKKMLNLSEREGLVRLMLEDLKREGCIEASKTGCGLTEKGKELTKKQLERYMIVDIKEMNLEPLGLEHECFAFHIHGHPVPQNIVELRDTAVRAGADGVVLMHNEEERLKIPQVYDDLDLKYPTLAKELRKTFNMSSGDILLVGFSKDKWRALEGALAAAIKMGGNQKNSTKQS